ncbi:MAG: VWA domain-containing protein [Bacteroidales bacterium]|nr:VWA domain-containing protein [Bacteroidales bacterium]
MVFANPGFFYLFIAIGLMLVWYVLSGRKATATISVSGFEGFSEKSAGWKVYLRHLLFTFRILALSFLIIALARPQSTNRWEKVRTEGIDIVMAMDISGSMRAMDFKPNRLEAAKEMGAEFVNSRSDDRFGLVVFAGESFTQCPLTTDKAVVSNFMNELDFGMVEDGTAIGMGLATAVNRLKDSKTESKVIILLTDGVNNQGEIGPLTAAELASNYGIRVYTIGVGSMGLAPYPVQDVFGRTVVQKMQVEIDEDVLKKIAITTSGKYFRATDNDKLREIYSEIDTMEKTQLDVKQFSKRKDEYFPLLFISILFIGLEVILRYTLFRTIP